MLVVTSTVDLVWVLLGRTRLITELKNKSRFLASTNPERHNNHYSELIDIVHGQNNKALPLFRVRVRE